MPEVLLAEVLTPVKDAVVLQDADLYVTAGVLSYGRGLFERPGVRGDETSYKSYFRIRSGQFVYSKLFAWEGALAVVEDGFDGLYVSPEFPVFEIDRTRVEPDYVRLLCGWEPLWVRLRAGVTGMGGRRKRVHPAHLLATYVPLPSLPEQRRIVDLVAAMDAETSAASQASASAGHVWRAILRSLEASIQWASVGDVVVKAKAGGTPSRSRPEFYGPGIPWLKSGEVDSTHIISTEESITDLGIKASSAWLMPAGTIAVALYGQGGTAGTVGFVAAEMASNQAVLGLVADPTKIEPRFLFHWLRARKEALRDRRVGSTQPNLNKAIVLQEPVPVLDLTVQLNLVEVLDSALLVSDRSDRMRAVALRARRALLDDLLSGAREIPDSYDELLSA